VSVTATVRATTAVRRVVSTVVGAVVAEPTTGSPLSDGTHPDSAVAAGAALTGVPGRRASGTTTAAATTYPDHRTYPPRYSLPLTRRP
jgi:hypothetical protein